MIDRPPRARLCEHAPSQPCAVADRQRRPHDRRSHVARRGVHLSHARVRLPAQLQVLLRPLVEGRASSSTSRARAHRHICEADCRRQARRSLHRRHAHRAVPARHGPSRDGPPRPNVKPEVFQLQTLANYKYRLVFDIYPAHPTDEISRLLNGPRGKVARHPTATRSAHCSQASTRARPNPLEASSRSLSRRARPPLQTIKPKKPRSPSSPSSSSWSTPAAARILAPSAADATEKTVVLQIAKRLAAASTTIPA